jgi:tetratricopeptide (TPR) repeat protein
MTGDLHKARELAEKGHLEEAWKICDSMLAEKPEDPRAMILASYILEKQGRASVSYHLSKRLTQLFPRESAGWTNLGRCADHLWRMDEAKRSYARALKLAKRDRDRVSALVNISAVHLQLGEFAEARGYAEEALRLEPDNRKSRHNLGLCQLANHEWKDGWENYRGSLGSGNRIQWNYCDEPEWMGEAGHNVVIFGEQGLGDEVCAASMFPDAIARAGKVILDCDPRLEGLFKRSFPKAKVYGTRNKKELAWAEEDQKIDASIASMQLGGLFRNAEQDFSGKPYLTADPDRVAMWKALWGTKKKPVIGIAWTGGIPSTGSKFRQWALKDLLPVLKAIDAHWVCLQYKDASEEIAALKRDTGVDIHQYPYATLSKDYDDTAALVASLDCVVSMQTAVIHLAGSLGVKAFVGVSHCSQWRYGGDGDSIPWYESVKLFRQQKSGEWPFRDIAASLKEFYAADTDLRRLRLA